VQYGFALGLHSYFSDEGLLVFNFNRPFDTKAHGRPFDKGAHESQNTLFDIRFFRVSFPIWLAVFVTSGWAEP
jgi:hypothetical protein